METLTVNLSGSPRFVREDGVDYIVAPMTIIVPGVLAGSDGPMLYPPEEVSTNVSGWNDIPITNYHPQSNGRPASASKVGIWEKQGLGHLRNARFEDGRLKADGWFGLVRTQKINNQVYAALKYGKQLEVSTGLRVTKLKAPAGSIHNGRGYTLIATEYIPDHLAVLPDQKGACSIEDGCGVYNAFQPPSLNNLDPYEEAYESISQSCQQCSVNNQLERINYLISKEG
jgi:hypothetical protein